MKTLERFQLHSVYVCVYGVSQKGGLFILTNKCQKVVSFYLLVVHRCSFLRISTNKQTEKPLSIQISFVFPPTCLLLRIYEKRETTLARRGVIGQMGVSLEVDGLVVRRHACLLQRF